MNESHVISKLKSKLERIESQLKGIAQEDLTTAERNILAILKEA